MKPHLHIADVILVTLVPNKRSHASFEHVENTLPKGLFREHLLEVLDVFEPVGQRPCPASARHLLFE